MTFGGPRSSCVHPGAHSALHQDSRKDLTPCRMALHFVSAGAHAPHSDETLGPTATWGSSHSALCLRSLAFLCSSIENSSVRNLFAISLKKLRIRIKHATRIARCRNSTAPAHNFFRNLPRGEVIQLRGQRVVWGQKLSVTEMRLMSGESLIILSLDASRVTAILGNDKRRWEIETLFKALKNQGFDFAASHLTELDRIEMLLALLAITFCRAHLLGKWLHEKKPIPIKSHHHPAISIFRYGLDWLREILFNMTEKIEAFYQAVALFEEPRIPK